MNLMRARNHLAYSTECPEGVNPERWVAMVKWMMLNSPNDDLPMLKFM